LIDSHGPACNEIYTPVVSRNKHKHKRTNKQKKERRKDRKIEISIEINKEINQERLEEKLQQTTDTLAQRQNTKQLKTLPNQTK